MSKQKRTLPMLPDDNTHNVRETQAELLAAANPALREKIDWIINWYKSDVRYSLLSRWDLGSQLGDIIRDGGRRSTYGTKAFHTLAAFCGEAEGSLRVCAKLALYYTRGQVVDLSQQVMRDGVTPLSFSHMRAILSFDDEDGERMRQEAIKLTLERCWTADQLARYVKTKTEAKGSGNEKGRPVAKPKNVDALVHQQLSFAEDFEKRNMHVWKNPEFSLSGQLAKVAVDQYTEELATQLATLAHKMRALMKDAEERAIEAERRCNEIRTELAKRYDNGLKLASQLTGTSSQTEDVEEERDEAVKLVSA